MSRATLCDWTQASELIADRETCVMVWRTFCDSAFVSDAGLGGREGGWGGVAAAGVYCTVSGGASSGVRLGGLPRSRDGRAGGQLPTADVDSRARGFPALPPTARRLTGTHIPNGARRKWACAVNDQARTESVTQLFKDCGKRRTMHGKC